MKPKVSPSLVKSLISVQERLRRFSDRFYDEEASEYTDELALFAESIVGSIEQFLENLDSYEQN